MMKKNLGLADRILRISIAIAVLLLYGLNIITGTLAIILLVVAGIFIATSLISFCPVYWVLKIKSIGKSAAIKCWTAGCLPNSKLQMFIKFLSDRYLLLVGVVLGGAGGWTYWFKVGCASGTCPVTAHPLNTIVYGMVMGGLLLSMIEKNKL